MGVNDKNINELSALTSLATADELVVFDADEAVNTPTKKITVTNLVTDLEGKISHDNLVDYAAGQHRVINDSGTSATELWSASKINTELGGKSDTGHTHTESDITNLDHTDSDAIHDNVSGEIAAITEKGTPVTGDLILIEDSADSNNKKYIQIGNLPAATPASHASSHQSGGGDAIKLDDLASPEDNTDLNVSTSAHGLCPKLSNDAATWLDGTGSFSAPVKSEVGLGNVENKQQVNADGTQALTADWDAGAYDIQATQLICENFVYSTVQTLTDGANINWDLSTSAAAAVTTAGDRTFNAATNQFVGFAMLKITCDGTDRTHSFNANFLMGGGNRDLDFLANTVNLLLFWCDGTNMHLIGITTGLA